jgi:hypothetical protein
LKKGLSDINFSWVQIITDVLNYFRLDRIPQF